MKRSIFLAVCLFLISQLSFAQAAQHQECALEDAVSFETAVALAQADYLSVSSSATQTQTNPAQLRSTMLEAYNFFKARIQNAADALPTSCWIELVTAENHLNQCLPGLQGPMVTAFRSSSLARQKYEQTGNREAYEANMRESVKTWLNPHLPQTCWFQPVTEPSATDQADLPEAWSKYGQCYEANQKAIINGSALQICYRPIKNPDEHCPELWSKFEWCEREYRMCRESGQKGCSHTCVKPTCPK